MAAAGWGPRRPHVDSGDLGPTRHTHGTAATVLVLVVIALTIGLAMGCGREDGRACLRFEAARGVHLVMPAGQRAHILQPDDRLATTLMPTTVPLQLWRVSPDGSMLAGNTGDDCVLVGRDGRVRGRIASVQVSTEYELSCAGDRLVFVAVGADGQKASVWICNADGGALRRISDRGRWPSWSRDQSFVVYERDESIFVFDLRHETTRRVISGDLPS